MMSPCKELLDTSPTELMKCIGTDDVLYFDSSGNFPSSYKAPHSIIAVAPSRIIKGHISDLSELEDCLASHPQTTNTSTGYPAGGLAGWVDYEGAYTFGVFDKFWVYSHSTQQWVHIGNPVHLNHAVSPPPYSINSGWQAQTSQKEFIQAITQAQEFIASGDIYQVNLSQQFSTQVSTSGTLYGLYEKLRQASPAPMATYGKLGDTELLCSSPETFLDIQGDRIETRPIKGTSLRYPDKQRDLESANLLQKSPKEQAELVMITDLLRNDLGQVCQYGSVTVDDLLKLESLEQVHHLVSTISGTLNPEISHLKALQACLPGGSITGAPKLRSIDLIQKLEKRKRGLYTGVCGYVGFSGESQFNIIIRSLVRQRDHLHYHVGAGIVADSDPLKEYEETLAKALGIQRALAL